MSAAATPDLSALLPFFNVLPGAYLLLSPDFVMEAASDEYLAVTFTRRADLLGRNILDAFPDNPAAPEAHATRNLRASLSQVLATGRPHEMAPQHYDIPNPAAPGQFVERYWLPRNTPVLDAQGQVRHIIHSIVNITERVQAEAELSQSQADELTARADADLQQQQLYDVLMQAPALICLFQGPQHVFGFVNPPYQALVGERPLLGRAIREAMPELAGQPIFELLDRVYQTGETFRAHEMLVQLDHHNTGDEELSQNYYNFIYQATRDRHGQANGILVFAYEVTTQVRARRQVEYARQQVLDLNEELATTNEELAATNEELQAANEEFLTNNTELILTQRQLQHLNQELEARVLARTADAQAARAEAERQRARLERLFRQAPAAICILSGPELVFELVNPPYQALFPGRTLLGKPILAALPELADSPVYTTFRQVYDTGQPHEEQNRLIPVARPEDGQLEDRYFNYIQQPRYNEQGRIDGVLVFAFETTEQVRASQRVEAGAYQLRLLTDALPVLIGYLDRERRYQFANEAYRTWFDQDPSALLGRKVREVVGEQAYATTAAYMDRALAGERLDFEATMPYREGFTRHIRTSYVPDVRQGQVLGFYTLVTDVTEQVEARQQVERLNQELTATNQGLEDSNAQLTRTNVDLDNFIYTASHDLKAPITNIEGLLHVLREHLPAAAQSAEPVQPVLKMMEGAVERFQLTIAQLTDVSRLQQAHSQAAETVELAAQVEAVRLDLGPVLGAAGAELRVDVARSPTVAFAPKNLRSIIYNLLSNAVKYRHPDRPPLVALRAYPLTAGQGLAGTVLEVQDNGLGLDAAQQAKLFGMFQRLHTHVEGSGIGLYMVKKIVDNAGGTITVRSEPGVGSTFTVTLPAEG